MKKLCFTFLIMMFSLITTWASINDSIVFKSDLNFSNESEKKYYLEILNQVQSNDLLLSMLHLPHATDSASIKASEKILNDLIVELGNEIKNKKGDAKFKYITQKVSNEFLKTFSSNCSLHQTIQNGQYNCLTTVSLYSIILSKLHIPYEIKEEGNLLVVTVTEDQKIFFINQTSSNNKCFSINEHYRDKWTKSMYYAKVIPYNEFAEGYSNNLFEKYYYGNIKLSEAQILSRIYNYLALQYTDEKKLEEAFQTMQKAYYLEPSMRNLMSIKYVLFNALGRNNYETRSDFEKLIMLCRFNNLNDAEVSSEFIISEFTRYLNTQIRLKTVFANIEKDYNQLIQLLTNSNLKDEIVFNFNLQIGKLMMSDPKALEDFMPLLSTAYKVKPKDVDLNSAIMQSLSIQLESIKEGDKALQLVEKYCTYFNELSQSVSINTIKVHSYLDMSYRQFNTNKIAEGEENLKKSEQLCNEFKVVPDISVIEKAYLSAAKYYFNKGNKAKAKAYLLKGFEYAPQSKMILDKLKLVQ
jgi:tetratricopeptide (TPR) repeat protein